MHGLRSKTSTATAERYASDGPFRPLPDEFSPSVNSKTTLAALLEQYCVEHDSGRSLQSVQFFSIAIARVARWSGFKIHPSTSSSIACRYPTREEVHRLDHNGAQLRYRIVSLVIYSLGLRISEGLALGSVRHRRFTATRSLFPRWQGRQRSSTFPMPALRAGKPCVASGRLTAIPVAVSQSGRQPIPSCGSTRATDGCQRRAGGTESSFAWNGDLETELQFTRRCGRLATHCWRQGMDPGASSSPCSAQP